MQTEITIYVNRAQNKAERSNLLKSEFVNKKKELQNQSKGKNLYIKNLGPGIDDQTLRDAFQEFGDITSAKVCYIQLVCIIL